MSAWYAFEYVNLDSSTSWLRKKEPRNPSLQSIETYFNTEHFKAAIRYYFTTRGIRLTESVVDSFVDELYEDHGEAFERTLISLQRFDDPETVLSAFGGKLPPVLKVLKYPTPEQFGLSYRFALLEEIFRTYLGPGVRRIGIRSYRRMYAELQVNPKYRKLAIRMRRAAALADGRGPDEAIAEKGDRVQEFGCLFFILC